MRHPLRSLALVAVSIATTACAADSRSGATHDRDLPFPEFREPSPTADEPGIASVTPESGSSKTRWTLHGVGLAAVDAVWFGDSAATIESTSETEIVVTNAFGQRAQMGILPVSFSQDGVVRAGPSVFAYPDGTVREAGKESRTWHRTTGMTANATTIWVVDSSRGLYSVNRLHDTVRLEAKNDEQGLGTLTSVFVSPSGEVLVTDENSDGNRRLFRRTDGGWTPLTALAEPLVDVAFGTNGTLFLADSMSIRKVLADGSDVPSFAPVIPDQIGGAYLQGGVLFVTQKWNGTILAIEPTWGEVTDLGIAGLSTPGALAGDGSLLFVVDDGGIRTVDADGQVQSWTSRALPFPSYGSINRMAVSGSAVFVSAPDGISVIELGSSMNARIAAAGIGSAYGVAHVDGALVVSSYESCFDESGSSALPLGVVYALTPGAARIVSRTVCPMYGIGAAGDDAVVYTSVSTDGSRAEVGRLTLGGERQVLATEADGLRFPMNAVADASGNVYVSEADFQAYPTRGVISRIGADGSFTSEWAYSPNAYGYSWALAISGNDLWMTDVAAMGLWKVALDQGGETAAVPSAESLFASTDGIVADGNGGVLVADLVSNAIYQLDSLGTLSQKAGGFESPAGIDIDAATGDVQAMDLGFEGVGLHSIMP